jgi:uncharacterized OB-fold protein
MKFQSDEYLKAHGGSWGVCKYQEEVERLTGGLAAVTRELDEHHHHIASHCPKPGHFRSPVKHMCEMCHDAALAKITALEEAGDVLASSTYCVGLYNRHELKAWRQVRGVK